MPQNALGPCFLAFLVAMLAAILILLVIQVLEENCGFGEGRGRKSLLPLVAAFEPCVSWRETINCQLKQGFGQLW